MDFIERKKNISTFMSSLKTVKKSSDSNIGIGGELEDLGPVDAGDQSQRIWIFTTGAGAGACLVTVAGRGWRSWRVAAVAAVRERGLLRGWWRKIGFRCRGTGTKCWRGGIRFGTWRYCRLGARETDA